MEHVVFCANISRILQLCECQMEELQSFSGRKRQKWKHTVSITDIHHDLTQHCSLECVMDDAPESVRHLLLTRLCGRDVGVVWHHLLKLTILSIRGSAVS